MEIQLDDLNGPEIRALIGEHLANMAETSLRKAFTLLIWRV